MRDGNLSAIVHQATTAINRRASLTFLGASLAGSALQPLTAAAANNPGKKAKKRARRRCLQQRDPCLAFVQDICTFRVMGAESVGAEGPVEEIDPECVRTLNPCCELVATCQLESGLNCLDRTRTRVIK
jgi:hypothetical protein